MTANLPKPPYYAVIFVNQRTTQDGEGYSDTAQQMVDLAQEQPGYLHMESVRDETGKGITVSYWADMDSIKNWKANMDHAEARKLGKSKWYEDYQLQISKVEIAYDWSKS